MIVNYQTNAKNDILPQG